MTRDIEFIDTWGDIHSDYYPSPAIAEIPDWYKKAEAFIQGVRIPDKRFAPEGNTGGTVKRCKPVFDSLTAGYLLRLPVDVNVRLGDDGLHWFEWPSREPIAFHAHTQVPGYPGQESRRAPYPKFINPWTIKTPAGYSCLFMSPVHRDLPFHTLEGIVDTDTYYAPIQFPFVFIDSKFEGLLEAGTPIVQVIPFKREAWKMTARQATEADNREQNIVNSFLASVFNGGYARKFWQRKEYR